ncbi:hypothetical protein RND61_30705 [Streptomyces sp. TRM76323]|uniref:Uncharacterized protein n=1 Tax=Streptomyces tamarix TaxID=3078565 RepID=A0ABU3QUM5_9ACTN|nr:hypothetical protein [Streptomyces tamarix]MDT9686409.1 hypothetical protein [Streptomyces tamarix]
MAPRHNFETPDDVPEPRLTPNTGGVKVGADLVGRRPTRKAGDWKSFSSYLPEDLQRRFRSECVLAGIEVRQGLDEAVRAWLEARQADKPAG